ncbi:MAG: Metallo-beta-lactamase precursor [Chthonomonadales bacterium]|nr:Metallo-beta-lactamase precursor [Chthonomonadales bacterium]
MREFQKRMICFWIALITILAAESTSADTNPDWTTPIAPFLIAGNLYYVGSKDLAAYLIVTPKGDILINASLESSPPQIKASVEKLGFKLTDIKILLNSHAHWDHVAGSAKMKKITGAKFEIMDGDVAVVESGGAKDFAYPTTRYPATKVDRILHDGDQVALGGTVLVAHKTPGHTRGCTTWTTQILDRGKTENVVIVGSWNVNSEFRLVDHPKKPASYPGIVADYRKTFATLKALPCDIFLGAHGSYFNMLDKLKRVETDPDVWIDPQGYQDAVAERQSAFEATLAQQSKL